MTEDCSKPSTSRHVLIVTTVGEPYGPFSTDEFAEYDIEHPDDCPMENGEYTCAVAMEQMNGCIRHSLRYSGTPVNQPGQYEIEPWFETYRGFDYTEYDAGVVLVDA